MTKKISIILLSIFAFILPAIMYTPSFAAGSPPSTPSDNPCNNTVLGLVPWNCNVNIQDEESLKSGIWTIAANIAVDVSVIAAYLVTGYVLYGGYLYMFSAGDTNKVMKGKKALHQAFLGLAIVISANVILNGIRFALLGSSGHFFSDNCLEQECVNPVDMVTGAINWVIGIAGVISAIFIVYGGTSYMTSQGEAAKIQKAKNMITYALIGLAIVALAEIIVVFASNIINDANKTSYIESTITKEYYV